MQYDGAQLRHNPSLVLRLVRGAALWAIPFLLLAAVALTLFYRTSTYRLFDEQLDSTLTALIASAETVPGNPPEITIARMPIDPRYQRALSGRYWLIGRLEPGGRIIPIQSSRSMTSETLILPKTDALRILTQPGVIVRTRADGPDDNDPLRVLATSVVLENLPDEQIVMASAALSRPADMAVRNFAMLATGLMLLLTTGLIIAVFAQVRLGLKPLFDLRNRVADVREGRAPKVEGDYPSEIQPLASELNSLIDHNKSVVDQAQTHVSNLAHALKTPLAVLLNEAGASKTELGDIVQRQADAMKNQVDHHLRRARAATRGQTIGVSTSVEETISPLARTLERIYRDKDIGFTVNIRSDLAFRGEKRDLEEMVGNLMDNACKWTASKVVIDGRRFEDTMLEISVSDDGPGLPADKYAHALKRGTRLDEATPGTGFGLAIVDDLARAYKGELILDTSYYGGLKVSLRLPRTIET